MTGLPTDTLLIKLPRKGHNQALFSWKNKNKYFRISSAAHVSGTLRVNPSPAERGYVLPLQTE